MNLPYHAAPMRGSSSFQAHTRCSAGPIPVANGMSSGPATASHNEGAVTRSAGNSTANPTRSTNAPASSTVVSRGSGSHRSPRAQASASPFRTGADPAGTSPLRSDGIPAPYRPATTSTARSMPTSLRGHLARNPEHRRGKRGRAGSTGGGPRGPTTGAPPARALALPSHVGHIVDPRSGRRDVPVDERHRTQPLTQIAIDGVLRRQVVVAGHLLVANQLALRREIVELPHELSNRDKTRFGSHFSRLRRLPRHETAGQQPLRPTIATPGTASLGPRSGRYRIFA